MSIVYISSKNRDEIQRIIDSAIERKSIILYYDALRILKLAGAATAITYLALNSQELMLFSSQIEPPFVLKRVLYNRLPDSGVETYKDIPNHIEALNIALGRSGFIDGMSFLLQEMAPPDLNLSINADDKEINITSVRAGTSITIPYLHSVEDLIVHRDVFKRFLCNAAGSEGYDIKSLGMLLLIICSILKTFTLIKRINIKSMFLYKEGLGYIITDAFFFLK